MAFALGLAAARAEGPIEFRIHDQRDPAEIDEVTLVYVDGEQVGTFRLGPEQQQDTLAVRVAGTGNHTYALCGRVRIRHEDGETITREVNGAGRIADVANRDFDAVAASDFTVFYLRDVTAGREPAPVSAEPRRGCEPHVASRREGSAGALVRGG